MRFIRQNLFLVILGGIVLVIGIALIVANSGVSEDVSKRVESRATAVKDQERNSRPPVNEEIVAYEKQRVQTQREVATKSIDLNLQWSRRNYHVLQYDAAMNGQMVPAFPLPQTLLDKNTYSFTEAYVNNIDEMLTAMAPTRVPTSEEVDAAIETQRIRLEQIRAEEELLQQKEAALEEQTSSERNGTVLSEGTRERSPRSTVTANVPADIKAEATRLGTNDAVVQRALAGRIYAGRDSLDMMCTEAQVQFPPENLWYAQINLWVTKDILAVIQQTNQQRWADLETEWVEMRKKDPNDPNAKPNVLNASVKRLVNIDINEGYFPYGGGGEVRRASETTAGNFGGGRPSPPAPGRRQGATPNVSAVNTLSQRVTSKEDEVVHYSFTVIMSTGDLERLLHNLATRNLHTVLNITMEKIPSSDASDGYYYGPGAVMMFTIQGELVIPTQWDRGQWDTTTRSWSKTYPPLLPIVNLEILNQRSSGQALREEDKRRLKESQNPTSRQRSSADGRRR